MKLKNVLFLMSAMLVLTLCSFGQAVSVEKQIPDKYGIYEHPQYAKYLDLCEKYNVKKENIQSLNDWLVNKGKYHQLVLQSMSAGDFLIKGRNQIFSGLAVQGFAGLIVFSSTTGSDKLSKGTGIMVGGLFVTGFILELVGINNMGKAGLSLNQNGIGVKVKF
jgi:hypothetical protein